MKKTYVTPAVEPVEFNYNDQVVVASGQYKGELYSQIQGGTCTSQDPYTAQ